MRKISILLFSMLIMFCTACNPSPSDVSKDSAAPSTGSTLESAAQSTVLAQETILQSIDSTLIQTSTGDLVIDSIRLVDEVRGTKAGPDQIILLILLKRADGSDLIMEDFASARQTVEAGIKGEGDNLYICTMGGILESGETALGCIVPVSLETYKFYWGDNPIIELLPPNT